MKFISQALLHSLAGNSNNASDTYQKIRLELLSRLLTSSVFLGGPLLIYGLVRAWQDEASFLIAIYAITFTIVAVIAFARSLTFNLRAGILITLLFGISVLHLIVRGEPWIGIIFLLTAQLVTVTLFGLLHGVGALAFSLALWGLTGWLLKSGNLFVPFTREFYYSRTWFSGGLLLALGGVLIIFTIDSLRRALENELDKQRQTQLESEKIRSKLQQQVEHQTQNIEHRLVQLNTVAEISRAISAVLDPQKLIQKVADLVRERFDLYYVGVFLLDARGEYAVLRAGTGDAGLKMILSGHKLAVGGNSMIGWSISHKQARIALDVGLEAVRFDNPHLPYTRSELALPILAGDRPLGSMTIQSKEPSAFDSTDIVLLQGVADSLATAIQNAELFSEVQSNLEEIRSLHRQYLAQAWSEVTHQQGLLSFTSETEVVDPNITAPPAVLEIPLALREQVIGNLVLETDRQVWSPEERQLIEAISNQAVLALENARLLEETQRKAEGERINSQISTKIWASTDIDTILRIVLQDLGQALHASNGMISLEIEE